MQTYEDELQTYWVNLKVDTRARFSVQAEDPDDAVNKAYLEFEDFDIGNLEFIDANAVNVEDSDGNIINVD